jgi:asparagine synthase (glutamine-hydrolysing)
MCGIAGVFDTTGAPVSIARLKRMTEVMRHRGPDGEGYWTESFVGLGHRRLAIIDLSPLGHQPMLNDDGTIALVYNGEIYNFPNLRAELEARGFAFRSRTDSEVVLRAYEAWGPACVDRFNGMFAFAIFDARARQLFLARDRYGIKPLYYGFRNGACLFASEIKAILEYADGPVAVSVPALHEYFSFQNIFSDLTLFQGIRLLPPAHTATVRLGAPDQIVVQRYWDLRFEEQPGLDDDEAAEELVRLFERAVNRQLISDVEVGSYLSGGVDSGSVTCVAARSFPNLKTFTGGFDLSSAAGLELGFDERAKAERLSNLYKTEHYEVVMKAGDMERVMSSLIWHLEDLRVGQSYPNFYVARLAGKFVKVVLSGAGGDELFGGYPWRYYRAAVASNGADYVRCYYEYWQRLVTDPEKAAFFQAQANPPEMRGYTEQVFRSVFGREIAGVDRVEEYINRALEFECKTFLHGLLVVEDKLSMAHGLETRVPFLDNDLVDFALRLPVRMKLRELERLRRISEDALQAKLGAQTTDGKLILRRALGRFVPSDYANGAKQGFSAPDGSWFKGESIEYVRGTLLDRRARIYDYLEPSGTAKFLEAHFSGSMNHRLLIWSLLSFEWWLRTFVK